jgi:hypothetical protein
VGETAPQVTKRSQDPISPSRRHVRERTGSAITFVSVVDVTPWVCAQCGDALPEASRDEVLPCESCGGTGRTREVHLPAEIGPEGHLGGHMKSGARWHKRRRALAQVVDEGHWREEALIEFRGRMYPHDSTACHWTVGGPVECDAVNLVLLPTGRRCPFPLGSGLRSPEDS